MLTEKVGRAELYLADCMDLMKDYPDKAFDIAIVDPPYGDSGEEWRVSRTGGTWSRKYQTEEGFDTILEGA